MEKIEEMRVMRAIISAVLNNRKIVPGSGLRSSSVCKIDDFDIEVMEKYLERWNRTIAQHEKEQADKAIQNQWNDLKAKHPDVLLLLRIGDFYVMYKQDAEIASEILGITLSKHSNCKFKEQAGFPIMPLIPICQNLYVEDSKSLYVTFWKSLNNRKEGRKKHEKRP